MARKNTKNLNDSTLRKQCTNCKTPKRVKDDFYMSYNDFLHPDGRLTVCKQCIQNITNVNDVESFKNMLRMLDRVYVPHLYESALTKSSPIGEYFKLINAKDFRHLTWADSQSEKEINSVIVTIPDKQDSTITKKSDFTVTDGLIDKWGEGYSAEEIKAFERKYNKLINNYGEKTALHTEGLITYIRYRVKEEMATASGNVKDAKEWGTLASKAAQDAKINVSQLSKSDISGGVDVLSQLFEAVESEIGVIPLLPQLIEQPYDDADMVIWATVNYNRRLEDKPFVSYRDIWNFYDEMLEEHFKQQGYNDQQIREFKTKRNNVFRDLTEIYKEPLYEGDGE